MGLDQKLLKALERKQITIPTPVQEQVIRQVFMGNDMVVQSETGSGKTLAYLLPVLEKYKEAEKENKVIILVPTHELAIQVQREVESLTKEGFSFYSAVIVGNVNIERQIQKLKEKPQMIVGTAGRILELIKKKKIKAHTVKTVILDEADKLLETDERKEVREVIKCTMKDRQLLLFSATIPEELLEETKQLFREPQVVRIKKTETIPDHINHIYLVTERRNKLNVLRGLAAALKPKKAMVFINKTADIEEATAKLVYHHYKAECLHGAIRKEERKKAVERFRSNKLQFLLATDIAARGLHFDGIDTIFHISIPENPKDYLHRAGRTGRNGKQGLNVLIVTEKEIPFIKKYERTFKIRIEKRELYQGKLWNNTKKTYKKGNVLF